MVVKNREVVDDNPNQLDLNTVANYIRLMDEQPDYVPPAIELIDNCVNIVTCLSQTAGTEDQLWGLLTAVENYLVRLITSLENPLRSDLIDSILDKFFSIVSDPTSDARPAMSVILIVLDGSEIEAPFGIARWLEDGPTPASIGTALNCLYRWITEWNASPALSDWVLGYMKKLEIACLEHHMASRSSQFLRLPAWGAAAAAANDLTVGRKVGLLNRGNTCYVNSVMQALLATRGFSNYVVLHMNDRAYWAKLAELFAKMKYSVSTKVDPSDFYETMNSMKFDMHIQHDTSEFLGYFFDLLLSYERRLDIDHDYSQPPIIMTFRRRLPPPLTLSNANHDDNFVRLLPIEMSAPADDEPVAGSSTGITASRKRTRKGYSYSRKRQRTSEPPPIIETRDSFVDHIFGGVILSRTRCLICSRMSTTRDVFRDLTLAFPEANKDHVHTIQSLVDYYCSTELLTADNRYKCPACGCKRDVERRAVIEYTPRYLIIVLKNFKFDMKKLTQNKLMSNTVYCHSVSLPTVPAQTQNVYTMYAAIVHEGSSMSSGHYYTLAKTEDGWHLFNDDTVTKCNEDQIQFLRPCNTPYMLFYRRNDVPDIPFPLLSEIPANIKDKVKAHNKQYIETVQKIQMTRP
ncbi:PREDICTED: ubiquitin carboxyl-terminal hydrolase 46-like isoform X2 [Papilio polytes]|uniref:ubiquitin carboxyl-terminal hydrolase 46-like isoform X2 n=1 Tax=Papilio polytes TaxID=76194 RepID=UPI00067659E5|nr:PREDICTED: ubiquitin carboxyl-terminal hydrolase 46-like isoform X2 [Papilio polytes]